MDEDSFIFTHNDNEKYCRKEEVTNNGEDEEEDSSSSCSQISQACLTQSSFLVPKIDLRTSTPAPDNKSALGASLTYNLISPPGTSAKSSEELFVLDAHLPNTKKLNPMAQEFLPSVRVLPKDYSAAACLPSKISLHPVKESTRPPSTDDTLLSLIKKTLKSNRLLILMRGCPGSGKSTLARKIYQSLESSKCGIILSTDNYFNETGSHYHFDSAKLPGAHAWNKSQANAAMSEQTDLIIIDNTNVSKWEMSPYVNLAFENGYKVKLVEPNTRWKFNAKRLAKKNIHGVSLNKIQDMLSRYEKNVTVEQMLKSKKTQKDPSYSEGNTPRFNTKSTPQKKNGFPRYPNVNNCDSYCTSPSASSKSRAATFDNKIGESFPDVAYVPQKLSFQSACGEPEWGSDEWYEPLAQRCSNDEAATALPHDYPENEFSGSESSSEASLEEKVLDVVQFLSKEKPVVKDLSSIALACIEELGSDEIFKRASLAAVEGCKRKNELLMEKFEKHHQKNCLEDFSLSSDEDLSNIACSQTFIAEPRRLSSSENLLERDAKQQKDFYLLLSLKSDFTNLLTEFFGHIDNLNTEEIDSSGFVNLKLNFDDMKCLHQTLTQICASKKATGNQDKSLPLKENFVTSTQSLTQIMREQEESKHELEQKLRRNDFATAKKLEKICSEFPGYDPSVIENIFQETDYNMHETLAVLKGQPQNTGVDWRFESNTVPKSSSPKNISLKTHGRIDLKWLKISGEDQTEVVEFYHQRMRDSMHKRDIYSNGRYSSAVAYFQQKVCEFNKKLKTAELHLQKQKTAYSLNMDNYNIIDLHNMSKCEAIFILRECLKDYSQALEKYTSMKPCLIFITGKGVHNKKKKSQLKPLIMNFCKKYKYRFVEGDGDVKIFL